MSDWYVSSWVYVLGEYGALPELHIHVLHMEETFIISACISLMGWHNINKIFF